MIKRAVIVGGTHGNEVTGVHLVRHLQQHPTTMQRDGLEVAAVLANPRAIAEGRRYTERDLNRCFGQESAAEPSDDAAYEVRRAFELRGLLLGGHPPSEVAIFDLHTTTSNMGKSVVIGRLSRFNAELAAWLAHRDPQVRAYRWKEADAEPTFLSGICPHGFNVEVGPVANGVVNARILEQTAQLVTDCLDFLVELRTGASFGELPITLYEHRQHLDYPRDAQGMLLGAIHPQLQDRDFEPLDRGDPLFQRFDGTVVRYEGEPGRVPVFINEAAYYEKHIALTLTEPVTCQVRDLSFDAG